MKPIKARMSVAVRSLILLSMVSLVLTGAGAARAQMGDPSKVTLKTTPVAGGVSVIEGANGFAGGNVGVSVGNDGIFIIDDELQPMTPKLKTALAALSKKPVRFVINTHWHADHTGGNGGLAAAGAIIVAHDNVRKRLSVDQFIEFAGQKMSFPASPPEALPVVTFSNDVTLHLNGDDIHVFHVPPAHTDGDAIVHFIKANVVHMGDTFMGSSFPVIDVASGGQLEGFITAANLVLGLCNDSTRIIPGHGAVGGPTELKAWRDMLVKVRDRLLPMAAAKKTLEQVKAAKPTAEFDATWGSSMISGDQFIEWAWKSLPPAPAKPAASATAKHGHK
jgi:glyoxylase-like metal-dependent hydrolase (beta-lactamase superfamily II)